MTEPADLLDQLRALKAEDKRLETAREQIKQQVVEIAIAAIKAGIEPAEIYANSPYSHVWLRARIRNAGIPKATPGTKPKAGRKAAVPTKRAAKTVAPKAAMRTPKPNRGS
jgi:hypothetical protein